MTSAICVTMGILKNILKFHLHYNRYHSWVRLTFFPQLFTTIQIATKQIGCGYKKIARAGSPILLEYWWILQIVFSASRFIWSKCNTNNSILNAIDRPNTRKKKTGATILFSLALRTSKARKATEGKKTIQRNNFPVCCYCFSHFNSWFKYSKYLDFQAQ